ncbi:MAG: ATP-binding protein [Candidatus Geothermarchaeales archaeon]
MPLFNLNPKESPEELFGRATELDELVRMVKAKRWVAVLGPRMVGKTSLIKVANVELEEAGFKTIYVNLWGARRTQGLLNALAQGLNSARGLLQKIKDAIGRIEGVSFGPGGVSISAPRRPMTTTRDLLAAVGREGGDCVIELDEVQEVAAISRDLLRMLANVFNTYPNIVFVFTGSLFGLLKTLLEPGASSPLYGRSPAKLYLQPFNKQEATDFLRKGFDEYRMEVDESLINAAVEQLNGFPGWLTLYGNNVSVRRIRHKDALNETISEGLKIVGDELEHYLNGRDRAGHLAALRAAATATRWSRIKGAIEVRKGAAVNDKSVYTILESLKAAMLIDEEGGVYRVKDPMLRTFLLTPK